MTDDQFARVWSEHHENFSAEVDEGLAKLRRIIGAAYDEPSERREDPENAGLRATLAGLAASVVTAVLFASTVFVTTSGVSLA